MYTCSIAYILYRVFSNWRWKYPDVEQLSKIQNYENDIIWNKIIIGIYETHATRTYIPHCPCDVSTEILQIKKLRAPRTIAKANQEVVKIISEEKQPIKLCQLWLWIHLDFPN